MFMYITLKIHVFPSIHPVCNPFVLSTLDVFYCKVLGMILYHEIKFVCHPRGSDPSPYACVVETLAMSNRTTKLNDQFCVLTVKVSMVVCGVKFFCVFCVWGGGLIFARLVSCSPF